MKMAESSPTGRKHCEKSLTMFSKDVLQTRKNHVLFGNWLSSDFFNGVFHRNFNIISVISWQDTSEL